VRYIAFKTTLYLQRECPSGMIFAMIETIVLKNINATSNRRFAFLSKNFGYMFGSKKWLINECQKNIKISSNIYESYLWIITISFTSGPLIRTTHPYWSNKYLMGVTLRFQDNRPVIQHHKIDTIQIIFF